MTKLEDSIERVYNSIEKHLVPIIGPEVLMLPIRIDHNKNAPIAYTNAIGIWLRENVVRNDPDNAHVYIMHEIFHHVSNNHELMHLYGSETVNAAEDYWINYTQNKLFGFDVRKVKYKGLYNRILGIMRPHKIAQRLVRKGKTIDVLGCGCMGYAHPVILDVANELRRKYRIGLYKRHEPLVATDPIDDKRFDAIKGKFQGLVRLDNLPVDLPNLIKGLWMIAYLEKPYIEPVAGRPFTMQETLAYCWDASLIRRLTVGNPEKATYAVIFYIRMLNVFDMTIKQMIMNKQRRILLTNNRIKKLSRKKRVKRQINKLNKRIIALNKSITRLQKIKPLLQVLKENPVKPRVRKTVKTIAMSITKRTREENVVNFEHNEATRLLRMVSRMSTRWFLQADDFFDNFLKSFSDLMEPEEDEKEIEEKVEENAEKQNESAIAQATSILDNPQDTEEGEEEVTAERDDDNDDGDEDDAVEDDAYVEPTVLIPTVGASGDGSGKGSVPKPKAPSILQLVTEMTPLEMKKIQRIMSHMQEFESKLRSSKTSKTDEFADAPDSAFAYGNDMSRADIAEFALLHNPSTRMLFYSRLASNGITIRLPRDNKRQPLALMVDCSGSMMGYPYEVAVGFSLAMLKRISEDKRGGLFLIFSDKITFSLTMTRNKKFKINEVLYSLLRPHFGGTCFDSAFAEAYRVKEEQNWKSMSSIMISDGGDSLSGEMTAFLRERKGKYDKIIAAIVRGSDAGLHGINDVFFKLTKDGMTNVLTKIGNSAL